MEGNGYKAAVEFCTWTDLQGIRFCGGGYEAFLLPELGANLVELKDLTRGFSFLRKLPEYHAFRARPHVYGFPVLFPPNRIERGIFKAAGREYHFPANDSAKVNHIHGFLRHRPWKVVRAEAVSDCSSEVELSFESDNSTDFFEYFPHEFSFNILYRISGKGLEQEIRITNKSTGAMPLGLGFHTAFNLPFAPSGKPGNCRLRFSAGQKWVLGDNMMPTGELQPLKGLEKDYRDKGVVTEGRPLLEHYTVSPISFKGRDFNGAIIEDEESGFMLVYEVGRNFRHWVIWNDTGEQGFICPEPQTWAVNAPNLGLPDKLTGFELLAPGEMWHDVCRVFVQKM